ncbi:glycosyltransferase [Thalassobium sp. R2A62]|uniref:glycosyltransferase n=1 Tax=Thalassobium sp. R2A62 TaxID=633131 RepID=UPI0001B1D1E1|nr:glycosyltransferase [Thalassobium sp. R2A62]EET48107.1 glycosyltransferase [Thalassobium sp. R2A62]
MKVALVHYWLVGMRGGEKVLEEVCKLYPNADIFTHVAIPENLSETLRAHNITETFIAKLPGARKHYQKYLPLMPKALEALDLTDYDLVISFEAGPAKGIIVRPDAQHICYVHSPMRYIWDQYHVYRDQAGRLTKLIMPHIAHKMRIWDTTSAARVDHFIANSSFVAERIKKFWRRDATVIYPPVDVDAFAQSRPVQVSDFYLYAGELASYKRPDIAVEAFTKSGRRLVVIGEGSERKELEAAAGPNITFLGRVSFATLKDYYSRCRALIFPGVEDFGIVPVEVIASGRPVIALGRGGALDTVTHDMTGVLFEEATPDSLAKALNYFEQNEKNFQIKETSSFAEPFSPFEFRNKFSNYVSTILEQEKVKRYKSSTRKSGNINTLRAD